MTTTSPATPSRPRSAGDDAFWSALQNDTAEASSSSSSRSGSRSPAAAAAAATPAANVKAELGEPGQNGHYSSTHAQASGSRSASVSRSRSHSQAQAHRGEGMDMVKKEEGGEEGDADPPAVGLVTGGETSSRSAKGGRGAVKKEKIPPPLIDNLPLAWDEAHETFEVLERCVYETKRMGLSREQDEMMVCDCVFDRRHPDAHQCGPASDCVNRAIYIECLADECRAREQCRNQRFTKRQFGDVEIVLTEMKGYGLRAGSDIPSGTLIYEYIGEVVGEQTFRKRMASYADEGIRHFYFMMLQKEEYIDATKKGGIGRFANHSCNPNCEVQKWVVGRRLRMGIFSKRDILRGEEVTFNYNVDRYGHEAQICYCGEPNCVGYIGGKTQTDIGGMNDLLLDALGITDLVEAEGMKGTKKKKSRHLNEDFTPVLNPILEPEVQKVAAAIRQSMDNGRVLKMLLERIRITVDPSIHRQLIRMHGFSLMYMIITELADDRDMVFTALQGMLHWKLQHRNKVEDANIEEPVKSLAASGDAELKDVSERLLQYWSSLEMSYRIARKAKIASLDEDDDANTHTIAEAQTFTYPEHRRPQAWENTSTVNFTIAPVTYRPPTVFARPAPPPPPAAKPPPTGVNDRLKLDAIIALAQQSISAAATAPAPIVPDTPSPSQPESPWSARVDDQDRRKRSKHSHSHDTPTTGEGQGSSLFGLEEDDLAKKEKRLTKLVGEVVVKSMSKYKEQMDHETFKKYARDCTHTLVEKEKRHASYANTTHPTLSEEKKAKIKAFTKEFSHKLLKKLKEKGKLRKAGSSKSGGTNGTSSAAASALLNGHHGGGGGGDDSSPSTSTPTAAGRSVSTPATTNGLETPLTDGDRDDDMFRIGGESIKLDLGDDEMDVDVDVDVETSASSRGAAVRSNPPSG